MKILQDITKRNLQPKGNFKPFGLFFWKIHKTPWQYASEDDPLSLKSDFILSLCELIVGGKSGLEPVEKTIIDRCVRLVYREFLADPKPEKMPILQDLYDLLRKQDEPEARRIATALEIVRPDRALCEVA